MLRWSNSHPKLEIHGVSELGASSMKIILFNKFCVLGNKPLRKRFCFLITIWMNNSLVSTQREVILAIVAITLWAFSLEETLSSLYKKSTKWYSNSKKILFARSSTPKWDSRPVSSALISPPPKKTVSNSRIYWGHSLTSSHFRLAALVVPAKTLKIDILKSSILDWSIFDFYLFNSYY